MANRKVKFLTKEDRQMLLDLESNPSFRGVIKYAEETGKLDPRVIEYLSKTSEGVVSAGGGQKELSKLESIVSKLGTPEIFEQFLKDTSDESGLTKNELQDRLEAFQGRKEVGGTEQQLDKNRLESTIHSELTRLEGKGVADAGTPVIVKKYLSGELPSGAEVQRLIHQEFGGGEKGKVLNEDTVKFFDQFSNTVGGSEFRRQVPIEDVAPDLQRLQDRIATLTTKEEKDKAIEDFLSGLPGELKTSREQFLASEEERALSALERQVPLVLQNLNVRGMLQSGERVDELTTRALNLDASLEEIQADLEVEDNQFYYDSAFQNALRNELSKVEDYRSAISGARKKVMTGREEKFRSSQSELDRQMQEDLTTSAYSRNIALKRKEAQRQQQQQQDQNRLGVLSKIAETGANIATNIALKKVG